MRPLSAAACVLFTIACSFACENLCAQSPPVKQWDKRLGGFRTDNMVNDIQELPGGGYIVGGTSDSYALTDDGDNSEEASLSEDFWIIRTNADGSKIWDKMLGPCGTDVFARLVQTPDGGFLVAGSSSSDNPLSCGRRVAPDHGHYDFYVVKLNADGIFQWDAAYGGSSDDMLLDAQPTDDGGFILGGTTAGGVEDDITVPSRGGSDYWIVKIDANGVKQWDARFGGSGDEALAACRPTTDGGFILGGSSTSPISGDKTAANHGADNSDQWVVKISAARTKQWDKAYGGNGPEQFCDMRQTTDGGYIILGATNAGVTGDISENTRGGYDYWMLKITAVGIKQWDKRFGGSEDDIAGTGRSIEQLADEGYIIAGYSLSGVSGDRSQPSWGSFDYWMVRTNADGSKRWDVRFGGDREEFLGSVNTTSDGGFIIAGMSASGISGDRTQTFVGPPTGDYWLVKTTADPPCESPGCNGASCGNDKAAKHKIKVCHKGKVMCIDEHAVKAHIGHGDQLGSCAAASNSSIDVAESNHLTFSIHPNPAKQYVTIQFASQDYSPAHTTVYDVTGKTVLRTVRPAFKGSNKYTIELPSLPSGTYIMEVRTLNETHRQKILVVR